ncbi:UNVERIFIED_CONTAM: hypothetical protein GTU68_013275, partial [Idotea baltica]|nr:hypothetical protein [Idotea baltica]
FADDNAAGLVARRPTFDRNQGRLQRRRLRCLHGDGDRWQRCQGAERLHPVPAAVAGQIRAHSRRRQRPGWRPAPSAGGNGRPSRQPVRFLHAGLCHVDDHRTFERCHQLRRSTGGQPVPLYRIAANFIRAAEAAAEQPVPQWVKDDASAPAPSTPLIPESADDLAAIYAEHPDATLVAGATDVGLWVTKQLRDLDPVIFLNRCEDLKTIEIDENEVRLGAMVDMNAMGAAIADLHPSYGEMIRRYASVQVRNAATVGGNIANGSPIGDNPPALIALGATLHLRKGDSKRSLPLQDFFVAYGKQDRQPGEFVEAVSFPRQPDRLKCYKLSKRFDQDISAVCGCFNVTVADGVVTQAKIAFAPWRATPRRADAVRTL